jgi:hypothetical protein
MSLFGLPMDLVHDVYDRLEVGDRLSLNRALPPSRRVLQTRRTSVKVDRQLYALSRGLKRLAPDRRRFLMTAGMPLKLRMFMVRHASDPTVLALLAEYGVVTAGPSAEPEDQGPRPAAPRAASGNVDVLLNLLDLRDGAGIRAFSSRSDDDAVACARDGSPFGSMDELARAGREMVGLLVTSTADVVDAVLSNADARRVFVAAAKAAAPFGPRIQLFDLLNRHRLNIVERLLRLRLPAGGDDDEDDDEAGPELRAVFGVCDAGVREFLASHAALICCAGTTRSAEMTRFVLRHFGRDITGAIRADLLDAAVGNFDVEATLLLLADG